MKKLLIIFLALFLYANNLTFIQPNSYYTKSNLSSIYNKLLAYEETNKLIEVINALLDNENFKNNIYAMEIGKTKISSIDLLKQLKYFLAGWPKYSDTNFDNNDNIAGIEKILKDSIENDPNFINIPQNVINDMKNSILNLNFFKIANKIEDDLTHKNLKNEENLQIL